MTMLPSPEGISLVLFDLDNTLYPASAGLQDEIRRRISLIASKILNLPPEETLEMRKAGYRKHGTTLRWLQAEHNFSDIDRYLDEVHPKDLSPYISSDPELREALLSIPCRRAVMTNSPREHALRVLDTLGIRDSFEKVYDIRYVGYTGKPHASAFGKVLKDLGLAPQEVLFVDDSPLYLRGFAELEGKILLVDESGSPSGNYPTIRKASEIKKVFLSTE